MTISITRFHYLDHFNYALSFYLLSGISSLLTNGTLQCQWSFKVTATGTMLCWLLQCFPIFFFTLMASHSLENRIKQRKVEVLTFFDNLFYPSLWNLQVFSGKSWLISNQSLPQSFLCYYSRVKGRGGGGSVLSRATPAIDQSTISHIISVL